MKGKLRFGWLAIALVAMSVLATQAQAERALITTDAVNGKDVPGGIEGACGIAFRSGLIYVSDYYHHAIDVFHSGGAYLSRIAFDPLDGPCQLATSASGALYGNDWHRSVSRLLPSALAFDQAESTGVAVDQATADVYVNDRTYVAVYEPSGVPLLKAGQPLKIGLGSLGDGYGLAVFGSKVYVPDASDDTVKVYEPALDPLEPSAVLSPPGGFSSLLDAAVAVDPTNAHLLVLDNLKPGYEHPEAALDEFDSTGAFLGQVAKKLVDGEPSGLAFSGANLYATSGNSEAAKVFMFEPYSLGGGSSQAKEPQPPPSPSALSAGQSPTQPRTLDPLAQAVVIQRGGIKLSFDGKLAPKRLPRHGSAPVRVAVAAKISGTDEKEPPQLRTIAIAINRYGHFDPTGLPICTEAEIQPATSQNALKACRGALVGAGSFSAEVSPSRQAPFPSKGKMLAFNGRSHGRPAILAQVYGKSPIPTSFTFPFELIPSKGTYGTVLKAKLPQAGAGSHITGLSMNLGRNFTYKGKRHSYLSASCPAPKGFSKALFPLAHAAFRFAGGRSLGSTLVRICGVRG